MNGKVAKKIRLLTLARWEHLSLENAKKVKTPRRLYRFFKKIYLRYGRSYDRLYKVVGA